MKSTPKSGKIKLSVVIPAYNEEEGIEKCVDKTAYLLSRSGIRHEIIVVNDGSKDRTKEICERLVKTYKIKLLNHDENKGYTEAIKTGMKACRGEYISYLDADLQFRPLDMIDMYKYASEKGFTFVTGVTASKQYGFLKKLITDTYYILIYLFFGVRLKNIASLKVIKAEILRKIKITSRAWLIDLELMFEVGRRGYKIELFKVTVDKRKYGETTVSLANIAKSLISLIQLRFKK